ncbi:MAG: pyridoxamine 5'-phosphate oxidase family protein [Trichlorobacter sp.]
MSMAPTDEIRSLLNQPLAVLATNGVDGLHTSLVAVMADERSIWFLTLRNTRKWHNLQYYPGVSVLFDSRDVHGADLEAASVLAVSGRARFLIDSTADQIRERLVARHPSLVLLASDPECCVVEVTIDTCYGITGLKHKHSSGD